MKLIKIDLGFIISIIVLTPFLTGCRERVSKARTSEKITSSQQMSEKTDCNVKAKTSKEMIAQKKADKLYDRAMDLHKKTSEKYKEELTIINTEKDQNKTKKRLGKIISGKEYAPGILRQIFLGCKYASNNIPFHVYFNDVKSDISALKRMCRIPNKFKPYEHIQKAISEISDLIAKLEEIKSYVEKHKEFRNENRFLLTK